MKNEVSLRLLSVPQLAGDEPFVRLLLPKTGNLLPTHVGLEAGHRANRYQQPAAPHTRGARRLCTLHTDDAEPSSI